jgi:hypothetical protein
MNLKISQFKQAQTINDSDIIPIVRSNDNYSISALSIFNYLSGSFVSDVYTNYQNYSGLFFTGSQNGNSAYSTYGSLSSFYVTTNTVQSISGVKTFFNPTNFKSTISAYKIYTPSGNSDTWNAASNYVISNSAKTENFFTNVGSASGNWNTAYYGITSINNLGVISDTSLVPGATAIKNIISITQATYDNLLIKDPYTFYVIY